MELEKKKGKEIPRREIEIVWNLSRGRNGKPIKQSIGGNGINFAATSFYRQDWKVKRKTEERRRVIRKPFDKKEIFVKRKTRERSREMKNVYIYI